jgi:hypothetical protein
MKKQTRAPAKPQAVFGNPPTPPEGTEWKIAFTIHSGQRHKNKGLELSKFGIIQYNGRDGYLHKFTAEGNIWLLCVLDFKQ